MELLGHSQISLTMNRYGHVAPVVQREVAGRMAGLLRQARHSPSAKFAQPS
jgi:integrase